RRHYALEFAAALHRAARELLTKQPSQSILAQLPIIVQTLRQNSEIPWRADLESLVTGIAQRGTKRQVKECLNFLRENIVMPAIQHAMATLAHNLTGRRDAAELLLDILRISIELV